MPDDLSDPAAAAAPVADPAEAATGGEVLPGLEPASPSVLTYVALLLGGIVLGLFGAVIMASRVSVRGVTVPWGLVLAMVAVLACVRGAAWLVGSRRGAALVGLGWVLPTLAFATTNPGGDILLPDLPRTYVYLIGSAVLVVLSVALPLPRGAAQAAAESRAHRPSGETGSLPADESATEAAPPAAVAAEPALDPADGA